MTQPHEEGTGEHDGPDLSSKPHFSEVPAAPNPEVLILAAGYGACPALALAVARKVDRDICALVPATPPDLYSPGAIRSSSDGELAAVGALVRDFPEMAKLPHDAIVDAAACYVPREREEELRSLYEAGVPLDWQPGDDLVEGT